MNNETDKNTDFFSIDEAAAFSGFHEAYVRQLVRSGKVVARRDGKNWYVAKDSLTTFLIEQNFLKEKRREELAKTRANEYRKAKTGISQEERVATLSISRSVSPEEITPLHVTLAKMSKPVLPEGMLHTASTTSVYFISPLTNFVHKLVAITVALLLTFGTYAFANPHTIPFVAKALSDSKKSVVTYLISGGLEQTAVQVRSQVAAIAENPISLLSWTKSLARNWNTAVDSLLYALAFPDPGSQAQVIARVTSYPRTHTPPLAYGPARQSHLGGASTTYITNPVIERVIETQRFITQGGVTEDILNTRLALLEQDFRKKIYSVSHANSTSIGNLTIHNDHDSITLTNSTWTGGTISTGSLTVTGTSTFAALTASGNADITGNLIVGGTITGGSLSVSTLSSGGAVEAPYFTATSTTQASIFPYASTTAITATTASTTNLIVSGATGGLLKTSSTGVVSVATPGTDYTNFAYLFPSNATTTQLAFNGGLTASGATSTALAVTGSTTVSSILHVGGAINANGALTVSGNTSLQRATSTTFAITGTPNALLATNASGGIISTTTISTNLLTGNLGTINNTTFNKGDSITITAASSTLLTDNNRFSGGNIFAASTTIGGGTQTTGLTISGGATTTRNLVVQGTGTSTVAGNFDINGALKVGDSSLYINSTSIQNLTGNLILQPSSGNVGIGTTTPWARLSADTSNLSSEVPSFVIGSSTRTDLVVTQSGNVGIGVTDPGARLQISKNNAFSVYADQGNDTVARYYKLGTFTANNGEFNVSGILAGHTQAHGRANVNVTFAARSGFTAIGNAFGTFGNSDIVVYYDDVSLYTVFLKTGQWSLVNIDLRTVEGGSITYTGATSTPSGTLTYTLSTDVGNVIRSTTSGNVGIGTTTPQYLLTLSTTTTSQLSLSAGAGVAQWAFRNAGGNLYLSTTTVQGTATTTIPALMVQGSTGRVGLGTTTPGADLAIVNFSNSGAGFLIGTPSNVTQFIVDVNGNVGIGTTTPWARLSADTSNLSSEVPSFVIGSSTRTDLVVTQSGNVGIGTTSPMAKLSVVNDGTVAVFARNSSQYVNITESSTGHVFTGYSSTANAKPIYFGATTDVANTAPSVGSTDIHFNTLGSIKMSILQGGNVGIGTTTPQYLLTLSTTTTSQLSLSAGAGVAQWAFRNAGGNLYLSTTTVQGTATTTIPALMVQGSTGRVGLGTTTPGADLAIVNFSNSGAGFLIGTPSNVTQFIVDVNGNVGVGKASPATALDVVGTASSTGLRVNGSGTITGTLTAAAADFSGNVNITGGLGIGQSNTTASSFIVGSAAVAQVAIGNGDIVGGDASGGFQFDASANDLYALQSSANSTGVHFNIRKSRGTAASPTVITTGDDAFLLRAYGHSGSGFLESSRITFDTEGTITTTAVPGLLRFYTANSAGTLTQQLTINSAGTAAFAGAITEAGSAVLSAADIDTCAEFIALVVSTGTCGSAVFSVSPTFTGTAAFASQTFTGTLRGADGSATAPAFSFTSDTNTGMFRRTTNSIGFAAAGAEVLEISSGGIVVTGTLYSNNANFSSLGTGTGNRYLCINSSNNVLAPTSNCTSSDVRNKTDIAELAPGSLNKVLALRGVTFKYTAEWGDPNKVQMGFVAQDVLPIAPEVVFYDEGDDRYSINYGNLTALLAEAIQELNLNLEAIIASSTATSTPQSESFAERFMGGIFARITTWLADAGNGIVDLFATTIHTDVIYTRKVQTDELCVGSVCVTEQEFLRIVEQSNGVSSGRNSIHNVSEISDTAVSTSTSDQASTTTTTSSGDSGNLSEPQGSPLQSSEENGVVENLSEGVVENLPS